MAINSTPLWRATAEKTAALPSFVADDSADVAVIGGGIMGATTALTLAKGGASVILLEAKRIGEGASSRPGGFVVPTISFGGPRLIKETLGAVGERLVHATGHSADRVYGLIRDYNIRCDAHQTGWYQPAKSIDGFKALSAAAQEWSDEGFSADILDADATLSQTGVTGYAGSWVTPRGGTIHPLDYTIGLVNAASKLGVRIFENSPVTRIEKFGSRLQLLVNGRTVSVDRVVLCTNAQSHKLFPDFEDSVVPIKIWQCATAPIPEVARQHLFKNGESLSDTSANLFTYRFDRDWRLITGSVAAFGISPEMAARQMSHRLKGYLNLPEPPKIDYLWSGVASVTRTRLPQISLSNDGVVAATACNGRGIALSTTFGEHIAKAILGNSFTDLPMPIVEASGGLDIMMQRALSPFYPYYALAADWMKE